MEAAEAAGSFGAARMDRDAWEVMGAMRIGFVSVTGLVVERSGREKMEMLGGGQNRIGRIRRC